MEKCRNYNFAEWTRRRALPPEAGMIRSVGKKHNTICIDFSDDFAMSGNLSGTGGLRKCIENNAVFRWLDLRGGAAA